MAREFPGNSTRKTETLAFTRPKLLLAGGTALLLCVVVGAVYILGLPPFEKKGEIRVSAVCRTLGSPSSSAAVLRKILPDKPSYSFDDSMTDPRTDDMDRTYETSCFVNGDGKLLVAARAEMLEYEKVDSWVKEVVEQFTPASSLVSFDAGDKAVTSSKVAAIYVPCIRKGAVEHVSVVVELKQHGSATNAELRNGLASLARNAALFAHEKARCDAPSKVTR
ncbi:hypothetical protein [Streptomyces sp. NPDC046942]|uniref:hypothetical protein n=1 Tax=Streptomyces sp. NPDC046942 TaxID=3155137 RepID=UPI0033D47BE7